MPFEEPPVEQEIALYYKGIKSATLSVGASDTQDTSGCDYVCDGTCDEVEINQAIAALPVQGGLIHLCEGTYNVCGSITIDKDNIAIIGAGASTVIRIRDNHNAAINVIEATNRNNLLIKDLRIDGNRANQTAGVMHGIYFDTVTYSKVVGCWAEDLITSGIDLENGSDRNTIMGNTCQGNGWGIHLGGLPVGPGSDYAIITDNTCQGNDYGINLFYSDYAIITDNTCQGNGRDGIYLGDSSHNTVADNSIINNGLDADITYDGISVSVDSNYNSIQGNTIRTTVGAPPPNRQRYGINIVHGLCDGNLVANNDLHQAGQTGGYNDAGTDTRGTFTGEVSPTGNTLVVAASNTLDPVRADFYCDNVSDETEINAAITALGATGGTVKLLEGTFTVDGNIVLASNVALVGQGAGTVITIPDGHDAAIHIIHGSDIDHVLVKDLRVDGNTANQTAGVMYGIYFDTVTHSKIVNCWVEDMRNDGIYILDSSNHDVITGNTVQGNHNGITLEESGYNDVQSNIVTNNRTNGIVVGTASNYNIVSDNIIQGNDHHGIYMDNACEDNTIADNEVINNGLDADVTYDGIILLDNCDRNNIQGNTIRTTTAAPMPNRQRYGINISAATCIGNLVKDNDLHQSGITGLFNDAGTDTKLPSIEAPIFSDIDPGASLSAIIGDHVSIAMADPQDVRVAFNFRVPDDFHQLVRARVVVVPLGTGNLNWGCDTDWGACGEAYNAGSDAIAMHAEAVTLNEVECLDINAALDGIAAGDHVGVLFHRDAGDAADTVDADVHLLQFWMQYV